MSYADVNDLHLYFEEHGSGGTPLVLLHGGLSAGEVLAPLTGELAATRRVIVPDLQGHGRTADVDRPFRRESFGDDLAALIEHLGLGQADLLGYSLGAACSLQAAIRHPDRIRKLVLVSTAYTSDGWFPEVREGMAQVGSGGFEMMRQSPAYAAYAAVAPDVDAFPALMDRTGDLLRQPFDSTEEVRALRPPTLLVYADADSIPPSHAAEFFALLGGGLRDANWDGSLRPASRLAVLPGRTHYDICSSPLLAPAVVDFLDS
jgi:pimeloyl-ACP methyl ester carboxylesterase